MPRVRSRSDTSWQIFFERLSASVIISSMPERTFSRPLPTLPEVHAAANLAVLEST
jgi:hypothetical protein